MQPQQQSQQVTRTESLTALDLCCAVLCCAVCFQVSPESGWVPVWRGPIIAVVVLVCCLFSLLLGAILISNKLQSWLKVRGRWQIFRDIYSKYVHRCSIETPGQKRHRSTAENTAVSTVSTHNLGTQVCQSARSAASTFACCHRTAWHRLRSCLGCSRAHGWWLCRPPTMPWPVRRSAWMCCLRGSTTSSAVCCKET